jgi:hypothetical protein
VIDVKAHGKADRVTSGRYDSAERITCSLHRINVKILRVNLPSELDDVLVPDGDCAELVDSSGFIVFEETLIGRHRNPVKRRHPPQNYAQRTFQ